MAGLNAHGRESLKTVARRLAMKCLFADERLRVFRCMPC